MAANTQGVLENLTDGYLAESQQIKGGYFVTDNIANINDRSIVSGSMCYNTGDNKFYKYDGSKWGEIDIINNTDTGDFAKLDDIYKACRVGTNNGIIGMAAAVGLKQVSSSSDTVTLTLLPTLAIALHKYSPLGSFGGVSITIPDGWTCYTIDGSTILSADFEFYMGSTYEDLTIIGGGVGGSTAYDKKYTYYVSSADTNGSRNYNMYICGSSEANLSITVTYPNEWYYNIVNTVGFNLLSVTVPSSVTLSGNSITFNIYKHGNLVWCYKDFGTTLGFKNNWDWSLPEDWRPKTTSYGLRITDLTTVGSDNFGTTFEIPTSGKISTFGLAKHYLRYMCMAYQIN